MTKRFSAAVAAAALLAGLSAPAFAEMGPDMTCVEFEMLRVGDDVTAQQEATKVLKEAAAAAGKLPAKLANTTSVVNLAEAIANRCSTQPNLLAMDAMLEGH
jgi:CheY-like chemotaxis protein